MTKAEEKALGSIKIDALHRYLAARFKKFRDKRNGNASIELCDALMSGYAIFSLKDASLLRFNNERASRSESLRRVYKINKAPSDSGMRVILDEIESGQVKSVFKGVVEKIHKAGIIKSYRYIRDYVLVSIDGVHHFSSETVRCDHCMEYKKVNGQVEYRHSLLCGVLMHPDRSEVLPLDCEPIVRQDGREKNDCERNAAKRLIPRLRKLLGKEKAVIVEDALGANGPHIRDLKKEGFRFIIGVKEDGNKYLFGLFERLANQGQVLEHQEEEGRYIHRFRYANDLPLNSDNRDIQVNFLEYRQIDKKGKEADKYFTWITDFHLSRLSVYQVMRCARSRWKIENETFNTLKNQGYNFEHNYGHGKKNLCTVMALLMMLAFLVDQLQQGWNDLFKAAWNKTQTKKALWEKVRQKFDEYTVDTMEMVYKLIAGLLKVQYRIVRGSG